MRGTHRAWSFLLLTLVAPACTCGGEPVAARIVELTLVPDDVDFGDVPVGAAREAAFIVRNDGNAPWEPAAPPVVDGAGFSWVSGCDAPVPPGATCSARVRFLPTEEGPRRATAAVVFPDAVGEDVVATAALAGNGTPATLLLAPAAVDFGAVVVGSSASRVVTLTNTGSEPLLRLGVVTRGAGFVSGVAVVDVAAGANVDVDVLFAPGGGGAVSGAFVVELCGPGCGPQVTLTGVGEAPRIDAAPRAVDFGAVVAGDVAEQTVRLTNIGQGALTVESVDVDDDAFAVVDEGVPVVLAAGEGVDVDVAFAPVEGRAARDAVLVIRSTDPVSPVVTVPLAGTAPGAGLTVAPGVGQFGFVSPGTERRLSVIARSTGDAPVTITSVALRGDSGFVVEGAPAPQTTLVGNDAVQLFVVARASGEALGRGGAVGELVVTSDAGVDVVALSFATGDGGCVPRAVLAHADLGAIQVGFAKSAAVVVENVGDAPCDLERIESAASFGLRDDGRIVAGPVGLTGLAPGSQGTVRFGYTPQTPGEVVAARVLRFRGREVPVFVSASAEGVRGGLTGAPTTLAFGPGPIACGFTGKTGLFFNDGAAAVTIESIAVEPAGAFTIEHAALPARLLPGATFRVRTSVNTAAVPLGVTTSALHAVTSEGLDATVGLAVDVTEVGDVIEEQFSVPRNVQVDVLFVIDNSGSMADDQELLAQNFDAFIDVALDDPNLDVQLGITTTDVISDAAAAGRLVGVPGVMTGRDGDEFKRRAIVGVDGTGLELGLEAMRLALERPENAGFVRPAAALAVIFVTDEEDGGDLIDFLPDPALSRAPDEYIALLEALKAGSIENAPILVQAVLPTFAPRYNAVVSHFGGTSLDVTSPVWGNRLSDLAGAAFSLARTFRLGARPNAATVEVRVDGVALAPDEFTVDANRNTVVLVAPAAAGATVTIRYLPAC